MKRLFYIFIVCIITTLPAFGDNEPSMVTLRAQQIIPDGLSAQTFQTTESVSTPRQQAVEANLKKATTVPAKSTQVIFEVSGTFTGITKPLPSGIRTGIMPSTCKPVGSHYLSGKNFKKSYQCPSDITQVTITFTSENQEYKITNNNEHTLTLVQGKKKYTLGSGIELTSKNQTVTNNSIQNKKEAERAKCKEKSHTKYENGRCVCESDKYEMHSDNNCYMTADALTAESDAMEEADYDAAITELDNNTRERLCANSEHPGKWDINKAKCNCPKGYELVNDICEPTDKTAKNEENKKLCEKNGNWNEKSNTCRCKNTNEFFDDDEGCVAASSEFLDYEKQFNTMKTQVKLKVEELDTAQK